MTCYDILNLQWSRIGADKCTVVKNGLSKSAFIESTSTDCCLRLTTHSTLLGYEAVHRRPSLMDFMHHLNISHMSNIFIFLTIPWVRRYVLSEVCMLCSCSSRFAAGVNWHSLLHYLRMRSFICIFGFRNQRYLRRGAPKCLGLFFLIIIIISWTAEYIYLKHFFSLL